MILRNLVNAPLALSAASIGAVVLYFAVQSPTVLHAAFVGGSEDGELARDRELSQKSFENNRKNDVAAIVGRSPFAMPLPTPPPPPPVPVRPAETTKEPIKPPEPLTYTGPSPTGIFGDAVPFKRPGPSDTPFVLRVGETLHGVTLVSVKPPWSIRVKFKGKEFDVDLSKESKFTSLMSKLSRGSINVPIQEVEEGEAPAEGGAALSSDEPAQTQPEDRAAADADEEEASGEEGEAEPTATASGEVEEGAEEAAPRDEAGGRTREAGGERGSRPRPRRADRGGARPG